MNSENYGTGKCNLCKIYTIMEINVIENQYTIIYGDTVLCRFYFIPSLNELGS